MFRLLRYGEHMAMWDRMPRRVSGCTLAKIDRFKRVILAHLPSQVYGF